MALTLHAKVDSRGEASLPLGEHDEQAEANTQTIHGGVQSRNREAGEAKRSIDGGPRDGVGDQREVDWGLQAWSVYIVVGLSLAYFSFRHGLPLTVRSALYPLIGERIYGPIGHAVDIFAVLGTLFGVATSLGLGVMQVNAGLSFLFDVEVSTSVQILMIAFITGMATISVVAGLDAGIRRLSKLNLLLAMIMLIFILVAGPTATLLGALVQNIGGYLSSMVDISGPNEKWTTDITYVWTAEGWLSLAVVMDLNARRIVD